MTHGRIPSMLLMVFEPDAGLGTDPLDEAKEPRRQGWAIDISREDFLLVHREWGEQFQNGSRMNIWSGGAWESLSLDGLMPMLSALDENEIEG